MTSRNKHAGQDAQPKPFPDRETSSHESELRASERLESLATTGLLDTPEEEAFDRATRLATRITGAPTALFSLVDDRRQFFKAQTGFAPRSGPVRETPLSHSICQYVVSEDEPLGVDDARIHPLLAENRAVEELEVVAYLGVPVHGRRGQVIGSLCAIDSVPRAWTTGDQDALLDIAAFLETEIALRKHVTERQLLIDELNHRVRNLFSIVNGLIRLGRQEGVSSREFAAQLQARIQALSATHHLIQPLSMLPAAAGQGIDLSEQIGALMAPYEEAGAGRLSFGGPEVKLGSTAATYLALAIHELGTNAIKYGALNAADGRLAISWTMDAEWFEMTWTEIGVARMPDPDQATGFGSRLIRVCVEEQLRGSLDMTTDDGSLVYTLRIPLSSLLDPPVI